MNKAMQIDRKVIVPVGLAVLVVVVVALFIFGPQPKTPEPTVETVPFLRCMKLVLEKKGASAAQKSLALKFASNALKDALPDAGGSLSIDINLGGGATTEARELGDPVVTHAIDECGKQFGTVRTNIEVAVRTTLAGSPVAGVRVSNAAREGDQCETTAGGGCTLILHDVGSATEHAFRVTKTNYDLADKYKKPFPQAEIVKGGLTLELQTTRSQLAVEVEKRGMTCTPLIKVRSAIDMRKWDCLEKGRVDPEFNCNEAEGNSAAFYFPAGSDLKGTTVNVACGKQTKTVEVSEARTLKIDLGEDKVPVKPDCSEAEAKIAGFLRTLTVPDGVHKFAHLHVTIGLDGKVTSVSGAPENRLLSLAKQHLNSFAAVSQGPCEVDYDWRLP
jgi:hypothetical protein